MHLKTKTGDIKDLNANFVSHLEKRDKVEGTSHADTSHVAQGSDSRAARPLHSTVRTHRRRR